MPKASCFLCHKTWVQEGISIFHVPKNEMKRKMWADSCGVHLPIGAKICGMHFSSADFVSGSDRKRAKLSGDAVPMAIESLSDEFREYIDASTQTVNLEYIKKPGSYDLEKMFEAQIAVLRTRLEELEKLENNLKSVFTEGQMRKIQEPTKTIHWTWKDISSAIALHSAGPRAYSHLRKNGYPLPCESAVAKWVQKIKFEDGVLNFAIQAMRSVHDLPIADRLCCLALDEMKVESIYEYDTLSDTVRPPSSYVQMVIARGLKSSWKQPVFCAFDCRMTRAILNNLIVTLHEAGYPVLAVVSDMGPGNQALWKELNISTEQTWFSNPVSNGKGFVFADAPHLLKLLRNHFLDTGLVVQGDYLTSRCIAELLTYTAVSDVSIAHKLSEGHLTVHHAGRQKVKLATQLFSHSTASALRRCYTTGLTMYKAQETASFIETVNDWFDLMNTKLSTMQSFPSKRPFGMHLEQQLKILEQMDRCMKDTRAYGKVSLLPFQKGVLISNSSLRGLFQFVQEEYGLQYLLTYKLNQDIVEHFFGAMRAKGGLHDHPSPLQFKYRLRRYLLARNTETLAARGNVEEEDETEWLNFDPSDNLIFENELTCPDELEIGDSGMSEDIAPLHEDALEYVAGYIIRKLGLNQFISNEQSFTWVDQISRGALFKPSSEFLEKIKELESIFNQSNGQLIKTCTNYQSMLIKLSEKCELSCDIKKLFFKSRMHFRIKHLNKIIKKKA